MRSIIALVVVVTAAAARADAPQPDRNYCTTLTTLSHDLDQLQRLSPDSRARDMRILSDRITRDVRTVQMEAVNTKTPATKVFLASSERLIVQTKVVADDTRITEVNEQIAPDVHNVRTSLQTFAQDAGCTL
jgi:hypothetical protein